MINRRKRRDTNHAEVIAAFKALGWVVIDMSQLGGSVCDLMVARGGRTVAVEVKTAKGKVKPGQTAWLASWPSETAIVRSLRDVALLTHALPQSDTHDWPEEVRL